ncbi:aspartate aminotransferase family protein [Dethiosulfatarculus sandiegensis]|uniref:Aminotransferase class III n=1 Tax=Dethiosulfatarculus sandiegensis TaxID=1429043 RepID=A0A0D2HPA2_9BACT|nr:aspartate aminotransferase family protein [Dethiosulfatarculus sandiegensis]KIX12348.1 hypothetical protein X474_19300 [Dethiosulfatarculus sandiegensis]
MNSLLLCHPHNDLEFVKGRNANLYTAGGERYLDLEAGIWCTALGHGHEKIAAALKEQYTSLANLGIRFDNPLAQKASAMVLELTRMPQGKAVFLSSGSEAVEFGIKAAALATGRHRFVALKQTYLGAYGRAGNRETASWLNLDAAKCLKCADPDNCTECDVLRDQDFSEIAAFVLEPGSGLGQVRFFPERMIQAVTDLIRRVGGLVVLDEVTTGMGRTGRWFGYEHYGIRPDIVCLGKGLGNGYPVSCVAVESKVAEVLQSSGFRHAQSHQNDPLGCVVACIVIEEMKRLNLVERAGRLGEFWGADLKRALEGFSQFKEIRGKGLMLAIELGEEQSVNMAERLFEGLIKRKIICGYSPGANAIRFLPALTIDKQDLAQTTEAVYQVMLEF